MLRQKSVIFNQFDSQNLQSLSESCCVTRFERFKTETDGLTLDVPGDHTNNRAIYREIDACEGKLAQALKDHAESGDRLQKSSLQLTK